MTNSPELRRRITDHESCLENDAVKPTVVEEDESYAKNALGSKQEVLTGEQKILGIHWNFMEDTLKFDLSHIAGSAEGLSSTKRSVVSMTTRFYDPLGVVSPCTVQFKVLFQQLCEAKLDWDEPMSGELLKKWEKLIDGPTIIIPRCYFSGIKEEVLSSSNRAYAAMVYLRVETKKTITMRFLASKTRVAPLRSQTIPRLKLLSALLLAKLMTTIFQALKLEVPLGQ